jgi:hypothetical protein
MELSFSPEAKNGLVLMSKEINNCTTYGFNAGITLGPFNATGNYGKNKCVVSTYGRP